MPETIIVPPTVPSVRLTCGEYSRDVFGRAVEARTRMAFARGANGNYPCRCGRHEFDWRFTRGRDD